MKLWQGPVPPPKDKLAQPKMTQAEAFLELRKIMEFCGSNLIALSRRRRSHFPEHRH